MHTAISHHILTYKMKYVVLILHTLLQGFCPPQLHTYLVEYETEYLIIGICLHFFSFVATVQLNLNFTEHTCSMGSTRLVFIYTHASMHVHIRQMILKLPLKAFVYALDMCTTVFRHTCAHQKHTHTKFGLHICACKL